MKREIISIQNSNEHESDSETEHLGKKSFFKNSEGPLEKKAEKNKQRVLVVPSRGISYRLRHLMNDLHAMMPHSKKEPKLATKSNLQELNELSELSNCNNLMYFETKKHSDNYLWISKTPSGPSAKFMVHNIHTLEELNFSGNCLKGSRPILSFDEEFKSKPELILLQKMLGDCFGVPETSRKVKPFIDHVLSFSLLDDKVWIRNYQIVPSEVKNGMETLVEIGPRLVLTVIRIFEGSFGGPTLYENRNYVTPNNVRRILKGKSVIKHRKRNQQKLEHKLKLEINKMAQDPLADVFE